MAKKSAASKKRDVRVDALGQLHVYSSFNNITIFLANNGGQAISWFSAGKMGFCGSEKNTPHVAQMVAEDCSKVVSNFGLRKAKTFARGPGSGRESAIRAASAASIQTTEIVDATPLSHDGYRSSKCRRA